MRGVLRPLHFIWRLSPVARLACGGKLWQGTVAWRSFALLLVGAVARHGKNYGYGS
jgi:hypothetical protein